MIAMLALNAVLSAAPAPRPLHLLPAVALAAEEPASPGAAGATPGRRGGPRLIEVAAGAGAGAVVDAAGLGLAYVIFSLSSGTSSFTNAILGVALATSVVTACLSAVPAIVTLVEAWVMGGDVSPFAFAAALGLASAVQLLAVVVAAASTLSALPLLAYAGLGAGALLSLVGVPAAASWGLHGREAARAPAGAAAADGAGHELQALAPSLWVAAVAF